MRFNIVVKLSLKKSSGLDRHKCIHFAQMMQGIFVSALSKLDIDSALKLILDFTKGLVRL